MRAKFDAPLLFQSQQTHLALFSLCCSIFTFVPMAACCVSSYPSNQTKLTMKWFKIHRLSYPARLHTCHNPSVVCLARHPTPPPATTAHDLRNPIQKNLWNPGHQEQDSKNEKSRQMKAEMIEMIDTIGVAADGWEGNAAATNDAWMAVIILDLMMMIYDDDGKNLPMNRFFPKRARWATLLNPSTEILLSTPRAKSQRRASKRTLLFVIRNGSKGTTNNKKPYLSHAAPPSAQPIQA
jgi:hypothetical protein